MPKNPLDHPAIKYTKVVGWGPIRLPGERERMIKAYEQANAMMEAFEEVEARGPSTSSS
jgi:hypothetical protein